MGFWKICKRVIQILIAGETGYEIKRLVDNGHVSQVVAQSGSVAQQALNLVQKQAGDLQEMEESLNDMIILIIIILAGVGSAVIIGLVAAVYAIIAKKTSKKIKSAVRDLEK